MNHHNSHYSLSYLILAAHIQTADAQIKVGRIKMQIPKRSRSDNRSDSRVFHNQLKLITALHNLSRSECCLFLLFSISLRRVRIRNKKYRLINSLIAAVFCESTHRLAIVAITDSRNPATTARPFPWLQLFTQSVACTRLFWLMFKQKKEARKHSIEKLVGWWQWIELHEHSAPLYVQRSSQCDLSDGMKGSTRSFLMTRKLDARAYYSRSRTQRP